MMKMHIADFMIVTSIFVQAFIGTEEVNTYPLACPYVNPIFLCIPREMCKSDQDCTKGQKCCMDCCGGHHCTNPIDGRCIQPNEVYNSCGSHCPPTCANRKPGPCILLCNPGCFCKEGYLRNSKGECVEEENCDYVKQ